MPFRAIRPYIASSLLQRLEMIEHLLCRVPWAVGFETPLGFLDVFITWTAGYITQQIACTITDLSGIIA
ncbi:MAG: hypothetical protein GXP28_05625 [Planctomycetes bacterium]|nr:hypothetical protein [Planctomycetota bacterium]